MVGESGAGKSVLGLTLLGLLPRNPAPEVGGRAVVAGVDVVRADAETLRALRRRELGAVFQDPMTSLNPSMRIGAQIAEAAGGGAESLRLLEAVGFPDARRRLGAYPHELSGGLRQRAMIAMALAGNPSLIVADEPTTALDVTVQAQILRLIARLRDAFATSFLLITHDLGVAARVADRIVVVYGGRVVESGATRELLRAPAHPYTAGLLRARMTLRTPRDRAVATLPGEPPDPRAPPPGCPFAPRCPLAVPACATGDAADRRPRRRRRRGRLPARRRGRGDGGAGGRRDPAGAGGFRDRAAAACVSSGCRRPSRCPAAGAGAATACAPCARSASSWPRARRSPSSARAARASRPCCAWWRGWRRRTRAGSSSPRGGAPGSCSRTPARR